MAAYTSHFTILRATSWHHGASDLIHCTCSIHFHSSPFCDTLPTLPRQVKQARGLGSDFPRARTPGCMQPSSGVESSRLSLCAQPSCHRARGVCDEAMGICVPPCADVRREFPVSLGHPLEHHVYGESGLKSTRYGHWSTCCMPHCYALCNYAVVRLLTSRSSSCKTSASRSHFLFLAPHN